MFERFTDRARRVVVLAQEEARRLDHDYIGTEHLLLGLLAVPEGVAGRTLTTLGVTADQVRQEVEKRIGRGSEQPKGHIPFTPRAKKVLETSLREALKLGHNYIGTEHVLLGLVDEGEGVAAQILMTTVEGGLERVAQAVLEVLDLPSDVARKAAQRHVRRGVEHVIPLREVLVRLEAIEARLSVLERLLRESRGDGEQEVS